MSKVQVHLSYLGRELVIEDAHTYTLLASLKDQALNMLGLKSKKDFALYTKVTNLSYWENRSLEELFGLKVRYDLTLVKTLNKSMSVSTDYTDKIKVNNFNNNVIPRRLQPSVDLVCSCLTRIVGYFCRVCGIFVCESCRSIVSNYLTNLFRRSIFHTDA